jgi:hypothetical protein
MTTPPKEIPEADKPFYLAILSTVLFGVVLTMGAIGAFFDKPDLVEYAKSTFTPVFGLLSMAWAWYFKKS